MSEIRRRGVLWALAPIGRAGNNEGFKSRMALVLNSLVLRDYVRVANADDAAVGMENEGVGKGGREDGTEGGTEEEEKKKRKKKNERTRKRETPRLPPIAHMRMHPQIKKRRTLVIHTIRARWPFTSLSSLLLLSALTPTSIGSVCLFRTSPFSWP